jgi:4-phospho-D-threonate 3-dehydrogenase / 4-phospho-D-erythronate 3-dehydrogenase
VTARAPRVVITAGDPAGIGPEVVLKALANPSIRERLDPLVVGSLALLGDTVSSCGLELELAGVAPAERPREGAIGVLDVGDASTVRPGELSPEAGEAAWRAITAAVDVCLSRDGWTLVTAPINKVSLDLAGRGHDGHTEILQRLTGSSWSQTLFVLGDLRVLFYTRHLSLRDAIAALDADRIREMLVRFASVCGQIGLESPRIAVAALNPHAGEGGRFGREEIDHIEPAIRLGQAAGLDVSGPIPGDSVFHLARQGAFDVVLSLYHDQAAGVPKSIDFHGTISVTLGLPFLRLSVDHGTALDIAGCNRADPRNMENTLALAAHYASLRIAKPLGERANLDHSA